ncbi:molecular chaperone [Tatumella sp. JGM118]|uniref:fimbrial biogenesis chaperone n=1 Tax=Tatumella sp. JGM118 TaxID=2799796 RepID=UPI0020124D26|nr:fimbria/pilus periplasmic chaperone [Tatumella sp. JGM118]
MRCYREVLSPLVMMIAGLLWLPAPASAGVTIAGTRVIFPAAEREKSIRTNNKGSSPVLVQVWVDDGSKNTDINTMQVPFTVTPPVYRIDPGKGQSVRLIYNGMELPADRESVYWFNLLEIPTVNDDDKNRDRLELAFRTRIKIFYRPAALTGNSTDYVSALRWQTEPYKKYVKIENPTPYYFSFESVMAKDGKRTYPLVPQMLAPYSSASLATEGAQGLPAQLSSIRFNVLNDYGSTVTEKVVYQQNKGWVLSQSAGDES